MSITDPIALLISLMFAYNGWHKGIMRVVLGPVAMIAATVASYVYYNATHNMVIALLIGLFGPVAIKLCLQLILKMWNSNQDGGMPPLAISRILGAAAGMLWGAFIILFSVVLIAIVPLPESLASVKNIQQNVKQSFLYTHLPFGIGNSVNNVGQSNATLELINNKEFVETIKNSVEYKELVEDPNIQAIINDEETIKQIEHKDLGRLLTNPKFQKLLQDPTLLQKMMGLQTKITTLPAKPKP